MAWTDPMRRVRAGDPMRRSASAQNALLAAAERANRSREFGSGEAMESAPAQAMIQAAADLAIYAPVALGTVVTTPAADSQFQALPVFASAAVAEDGAFGVMIDPAKSGDLGRVVLCGLVPAQVTIVSATPAHQFARINSSLGLESATTGYARIIWAAGTSGAQWCLLALPADSGALSYKVNATSADTAPDFLDGKVQHSVVVDATAKKLALSGDTATPGNYKVYGTDGSGTRAWRDSILLAT